MPLKKNRNIPEWKCLLQYPESELLVFEADFRKRLDEQRLYFLGRDAEYAPMNYSIALFEDMEINIQSLSNPELCVQIREKDLVQALGAWFRCRGKLAEMEKELGLMEEPFATKVGDME